MKKFLFTLASLVAFGFAANAQPVVAFNQSEVTMGQENNEQEFVISIQDLDGAAIKGLQFNFELVNPAGELITEGIHLQYLEKYGTPDKFMWFGEISGVAGNTATSSNGEKHQTDAWDDEGDYMPGNPYGVEANVVYTGKYNVIVANMSTGTCYGTRLTYPKDILAFTVKVDEGWDAEYATLNMVLGSFSTTAGSKECEYISLKINNADYQAPQPQLEDLTGEIVIGEPTEDGVVAISYTGDEDVTITVTVNGEEVALTDGAIQLAEGVNTITVTVEAEGYNPMTAEAEVEWYAPVVPEVTEAPVITYETTDDAVIVTAAGNGEVILYCNGQVVENPCTIARGEQDATYTFTATAQEAGKEISTVTTLVVTVPAVEVGPGPEDPHMTGYWLVMLDQNNQPVWYALNEGEGGMTTSVALEYGVYGRYDHDAGYRGNVPFYFVVNGVMYGADYDMREAEMGKMENTLNNPLFAGDDIYYCVPVGYYYTLGIYTNPEGQMFVYCAQAGYVGVDELNANKAVAGVRYFNMAGQEMQEANGMTIVVTTYTDGTTSAVKVMK